MAIVSSVSAGRLDSSNGLAASDGDQPTPAHRMPDPAPSLAPSLAQQLQQLVNPHRQCAWCGRMLRLHSAAAYGQPHFPLLRGASHGICSSCRRAVEGRRHA